MIEIRGDFNHKDARGRVRLNTPDALEDLKRIGDRAKEGLRVLVLDLGGYRAECILELENGEWRAREVPGTGKAW